MLPCTVPYGVHRYRVRLLNNKVCLEFMNGVEHLRTLHTQAFSSYQDCNNSRYALQTCQTMDVIRFHNLLNDT